MEEASAALPIARVRLPISVSIGHEAVTVKPARIMAVTSVSHASGSL
jgi:hypothetical protein